MLGATTSGLNMSWDDSTSTLEVSLQAPKPEPKQEKRKSAMATTDRPQAASAMASKNRQASTVNFEGKMARTPSMGRKLMASTARDPRAISAGSTMSEASTWSCVDKPAASILALRNRIIITIDKAITLLDLYERRFLHDADDDFQGVYQEFVKQLLARIGYKNDLFTCDQLETVIIRRFQSEAQIARRSDFKALAMVCRRARGFKELRSQVQSRLDEVYDYADTFCVPFSNETEGYSFESLELYENIRTECLRNIKTNMEAVHVSCEELRDIQPMVNYLEQYNKVIHHIEHIVRCLRCASVNLKRWVVADEQYEKSLEKEIAFLGQKSKALSSDRLTLSNVRYEVKARAPNASGKLRKVELTLNRCQTASERLEERQKSLNQSILDVQESQRRVRRQLADVERTSGRRQSPQNIMRLLPAAEQLKQKISSLQAKEDLLTSHLTQTKQDIANNLKEIHSLESEKIKRKRSVDRVTDRVSEQKSAIKSQHRVSTSLLNKVRVLQKLRSLKRNPETLRKIEFNMINIDYKEAMQRACTDVAYKVGDNWPIVYLKLPFMPPRTPQKRQEDIRAIIKSGSGGQKDTAEMAYLAFERWAKRSTSATINELVYASKSFVEETTRKESAKKTKYTVPRTKKRFQQLKAKSNVIYV